MKLQPTALLLRLALPAALIAGSCSSPGYYSLESHTERFSSMNGLCTTEYNYPILYYNTVKQKDTVTLNLTGLKKIGDFEEFVRRFSVRDSGVHVTVNYEVLMEEDSVLSIEYITTITDSKTKIYHSVLINPMSLRQYSLDDLFEGDYHKTIWQHVYEFSRQSKVPVNMNAYEADAVGYRLNIALTSDHLILYVGAEGEFHGYHRLQLPLSDFKRKEQS